MSPWYCGAVDCCSDSTLRTNVINMGLNFMFQLNHGTVLKLQVYAGKNDETSGQGHSSKIVFKLLEERLDCGHHVYMDNYYNSYGLAVKLIDRQTYCTGTLRSNRKDNPVEIWSISLEKGENKSLVRESFKC